MAWIRTIPEHEATGLLKREYDAALARAGKIYRIVALHSRNPAALRASMQLYAATTTMPGRALSRRQRELIAVVVSRANECFY